VTVVLIVLGAVAALLAVALEARRQHRTHRSLLARLDAFERSLAGAAAGTFEYVVGDDFAYFSAPAARLLGLPANITRVTAAQWSQAIHPDDRASVQEAVVAASAANQALVIEYRVVHPDQSVRWLRMHTQRLLTADGATRSGEGLLFDVTGIKEVEARLRERDTQLREAAASAGIVIWNLDLDTMVLHIDLLHSPGASRRLPEKMSFEDFRLLVHPDDRALYDQAMERALRTGEMYESELRLMEPDGTIRWTASHGRVVRDETGRAVSLPGLSRDITLRKRSELELTESENRFRVLADSTPVLIWMTDAERRCTYVNQTWRRFRGRKLIEELGHGWLEGVHPDDQSTLIAALDSAYAKQEGFRLEYRLRNAQGVYRHIEDHGKPRFDSAQGFIGYAGCCIDVTERIEAEREIREREKRFSNIIEELPIGAVLFVGEEIRLNRAAETITGYSRDRMRVLEDWFRHFYPEDPAAARRKYQADRAAGFPETQTLPLRHRDGSRRWVEIRGTITQGGELWLFRDVTTEHQAQATIRKQQKLLEQVSRMAKIGGWELEVGAEGPTWSDEVYRIHELDPGVKTDLSRAIDFYAPEARPVMAAAVQAALTEGTPYDLELPLVTAKGTPMWVRAMGEAERENDRIVRVGGTFQDITPQRNAAAQLRIAKEEAEAAARAKGEFLANMSHEIRTPLNGVIGFADLLLQQSLGSTERDYAQTIRSSAHSLLTIINDILDLSKIEAGKLTLDSVDFDPADVAFETARMMAVQAHAKGVAVTVDVHPSVPAKLLGDPGRVRQVLANLCNNAVKFTDRGTITLELRVEDASPTHMLVRCAVRDTGIGIAPDIVRRLFRPFTQGDASTTRRFGGTGLGLSIVRQLAEMMGGTVDVHSVPDQGSTFWFTMWLQRSGTTTQRIRQDSRVVMVEPNRELAAIHTRDFAALGARITTHASLDQAVKIDAADLLILDAATSQAAAIGASDVLTDILKRTGARLILTATVQNVAALRARCQAEKWHALISPYRAIDALGFAKQATPAEPAPKAASATLTRKTKGGQRLPRVLLAEDNVVNQKLATIVLHRLGCETTVVNNGRAALEAATAGKFDLILMDCQMPEMDGYEATRAIRAAERGRHTPIIALTAHAMSGDREKCLDAGMDDHLTKPLDPQRLHSVLDHWLQPSAARLPLAQVAQGGQ